MKLIDILVQELPKHGGWPVGAVECCRFVDEANIDFYDASGNWPIDCGEKYGAIALKAVRKKTIPFECEKVTFEQYESALAASQPQWKGEGLPPVGCECEYRIYDDDEFRRCKVLFLSKRTVVIEDKLVNAREDAEEAYAPEDVQFRPILPEAERKRDEAVAALKQHKPQLVGELAGYLYDEIAAGKIPHIQLK